MVGDELRRTSPLNSTSLKITDTNISPAFSPGFLIKSYLKVLVRLTDKTTAEHANDYFLIFNNLRCFYIQFQSISKLSFQVNL